MMESFRGPGANKSAFDAFPCPGMGKCAVGKVPGRGRSQLISFQGGSGFSSGDVGVYDFGEGCAEECLVAMPTADGRFFFGSR